MNNNLVERLYRTVRDRENVVGFEDKLVVIVL